MCWLAKQTCGDFLSFRQSRRLHSNYAKQIRLYQLEFCRNLNLKWENPKMHSAFLKPESPSLGPSKRVGHVWTLRLTGWRTTKCQTRTYKRRERRCNENFVLGRNTKHTTLRIRPFGIDLCILNLLATNSRHTHLRDRFVRNHSCLQSKF